MHGDYGPGSSLEQQACPPGLPDRWLFARHHSR